ncbi:MAG: hypothetical protein R6X12_09170 [bacterium]
MLVIHLTIPSGLLVLATVGALAHCDTMGGPVVGEARDALARGNATQVLKRVKPEAEP